MAPGLQARLKGFNASLKLRGVTLTLQPSGPSYPALMGDIEEDADPRTLNNAEREMVVISILRESLGSQVITVGDSFKDAHGNFYRVLRTHNLPTDIARRFTCELGAA